ncbi:hypothetical protein TVAG_021060 [Trichomonas vaginalis G3]|uniref:Uncharacterized protein n=1 Tax=Trichomonas vaginalis (strain ATCC PRA-98 / G3) TaxID=412133 RepID=A2DH88_TRIV3|nr:hypothetical protein TVAGG3_0677450 [Trichomonas vaginalis G3]EAY20161.1 hypothetical protein TVAG_021060 [Trichomonas vaginalis G3]KAI5507642.1 hypothetical protein TVAGG3_0677450 [Trichomonas vaginalis G3]|eukprot:XP_001581147.1 hypothetical protein [Trichomonas vaginalis G3]
MLDFRILGETQTDVWKVLDEQHNFTPFLDPNVTEEGEIIPDNKRLYRYFINVSKVGTYSRFRIENLGPDSYSIPDAYEPHANILSISKLLFFGTVSNGRIFFSPEMVRKTSSNLLKLGVLAMYN